jgi:hypothetical protein
VTDPHEIAARLILWVMFWLVALAVMFGDAK